MASKRDDTSKITLLLMFLVIICAIISLIGTLITGSIGLFGFIVSQITIILLSLLVILKEAVRTK